LILDEPTSALTGPQIDLLFEQIIQLKKQGIGVIYISHRMDEISRIADRVSILRDGELVATKAVADISTDRMVQLMAGDESTSIDMKESIDQSHLPNNSILLKVENLTRRTKNQSGGDSGFENISFNLNAGEVLGIGGLIGSGRTELLRAIFGADQAHKGCIRLASDGFKTRRIMKSPADAISHGIGMLVEDRKSQGLLLSHSVSKNISFAILDSLNKKLGVVDQSAEQDLAESMSKKLSIQCDSMQQPISLLSGGNQQKALLARWLAIDFSILLLDEPSRGVDARAKNQIQALIRELAAMGKAILIVSSETQELLKVSDRIAVMSNGRLAGIFKTTELSEEKLLEASFCFYSSEDNQSKLANARI
jgi:ribose transport system ATP-binding protein